MTGRTAAVMFASLSALASRAWADGTPCSDWCGDLQPWETPFPGTGPQTGTSTILELGAAGETVRAGGLERQETAAVLGFEFHFPLSLRLDNPERTMRVRMTGQRLGWRIGDRLGAPTSDTGGTLLVGFTETLHRFSRFSKLAATADVEGAAGLGLGRRLGFHTADVSARAVGAAGLAIGLGKGVGALRGHARVLRTLTDDPAWSTAYDVGAGVTTRFDWPGFGGPWPIEVWVDVRERRAFRGDARERELTTGINYVRNDGFSRIGIAAVATEERRGDGTTGAGRALLFHFERPVGDM
ncbi:MAG: hypothetical protein KIT31_39460 [Deltaproteobacteria bacterium]|nr:hypothetical protein [Deltaproteobacteria bacterium]